MKSKVPTVRQISWLRVAVVVLICFALIALVQWVLAPSSFAFSEVLGVLILLAWSLLVHRLQPPAHRTGNRLVKRGEFREAIPHFERSQEFLSRYRWVDRWRTVMLLESSSISFHEMAMVNIAFCHTQLGNAKEAKALYQKALAEYPGSVIAQASLNMIETFERGTETME